MADLIFQIPTAVTNVRRAHTRAYAELQKRTAGSDHPILSLEKALDELFGTVILNIEVKERTAVNAVIKVSKKHVHKKSDWDKILFSSSKPLVLAAIRRKCPEAALAFLSRRGSLLFAVLHRAIDLSAVGFHRLYTSRLALHTAKELGLFTYAYTVNRSSAAKRLIDRGIDGIVTDYPAQLVESLRNKD